jgi:hypothetical protein
MGPDGSLFIADYSNHRIRMVDAAGTITTIAGNGSAEFCGDDGPATSACLNSPLAVVPLSDGTLVVSDYYNERIRKIDPARIITTMAGTGSASFCGDGGKATDGCFWHPVGLAVNPAGTLLVADHLNHRVRAIQGVSRQPQDIAPGAKLTVGDNVLNEGTAAAGASATRYYLSLDLVMDEIDVLLAGTRSVVSLAPGAVSTGSRSVTVPASTPLGVYHLFACADDTRKVAEARDDNNCARALGRVTVGWPDLITTAISNPPPIVGTGGTFSITDAALNQGNVTGGSSSTRYYLSLDGVKSAGDILLTGARSVAGLAPGASSIGMKAVTVPSGTATGTYYVLACADDTSKVGEAEETNNCLASEGAVTIQP